MRRVLALMVFVSATRRGVTFQFTLPMHAEA